MGALVTYHLEAFDGPLDLLLHLIAKNKVNIYDIPIAVILEQYLEHLHHMENLDLEVTSEFVAMAAQLMYIKSKMLLPVYEEEAAEDPRQQLVEALLDYQRFKRASGMLGERMALGADLYTKPAEPLEPGAPPEYHYTAAVLTRAITAILSRQEHRLPPPVALFTGIVGREPVPVSGKIDRIIGLLARQGSIRFDMLVLESQSRSEVVSVFLAVLELSKAHKVLIEENEDGYILLLAGEYDGVE